MCLGHVRYGAGNFIFIISLYSQKQFELDIIISYFADEKDQGSEKLVICVRKYEPNLKTF